MKGIIFRVAEDEAKALGKIRLKPVCQ
jgi:hypothetical protein